jgi:hypothetical protein
MTSQRVFRAGLAAGLLLAGVTAAPGAPDQAKALAENAKARAEAARLAYRQLVLPQERDPRFWPAYPDYFERVYRWSLRWLEAEREVSARPADEVAALEAHLERMRDLERRVQRLRGGGNATVGEAAAVAFYRLEAEKWLLQAKKK